MCVCLAAAAAATHVELRKSREIPNSQTVTDPRQCARYAATAARTTIRDYDCLSRHAGVVNRPIVSERSCSSSRKKIECAQSQREARHAGEENADSGAVGMQACQM